ncbi:MAG: hypothetical protein AVDCRST_MAG35-3078 [uncultured Quadrisphaera sp.]|uniref:Uncharacterized protein n=1 Tax=uncultured Quadrisphaera sp. TaxID=904978 RepID=A0A6J4QF04_9ACTN|nr:MAG: hypothetical protein AVDCRST_MAG35-3078 [uncultured Quadrisphaera sp.]
MTLLALIAASWIAVSLVATAAFCAVATAVKRGTPALDAPSAPVLPLLAGAGHGSSAPAVVLPAQRRTSPAPALTV